MICTILLLALAPDGGSPHIEMKFKPHRYGTIVEIQKDALVVQAKDKTHLTVNLLGVTVVHRNGRDVELDALRVGDRVVIDVMPNHSGGLDAVMVEARAPPKRKKTSAMSAPRRPPAFRSAFKAL